MTEAGAPGSDGGHRPELFFTDSPSGASESDVRTENLDLPGTEARLVTGLFTPAECRLFMGRLEAEIPWRQDTIRVFGRAVKTPRLSAWYGDADYTYSGLTLEARPMPELVSKIARRVETVAGTRFNSVLLNLYRDGRDSMGWHSDDEPELGPDPVIASATFGAERRFVFRRRDDKRVKRQVTLADGSLLVMGRGVQRLWRHALPKTASPVSPRINLTYRWTH